MRLYQKGMSHSAATCVDCLISTFSAQWGFHPGGWGKPPLDEYNRPLYGDVFGVLPKNTDADVSSKSQAVLPRPNSDFPP